MTNAPAHSKRLRLTVLLLLLAVLLPVLIYLGLLYVPQLGPMPEVTRPEATFPASKLHLAQKTLGPEPNGPAQIANVQIVDFDGDGLPDVLACDAKFGRVLWYQQIKRNEWKEHVLNEDRIWAAPAHATVIDLDKDGDPDVLVAVLGKVWPTDERVGRVVWLENVGNFKFKSHILLEDVERVADVQGGDFDGDGDIDLVVAVFGYSRGQILYLENNGKNRFRERELLAVPGTIHVPVGDFDGDGDLDIMAVVSQDEEEIIVFENRGGKKFQPRRHRLFFSYNFDLGSAGLVICDLDKDGDPDLLLPAGDNLELIHNYPQPWHGCYWLENRGSWSFVPHRIAKLGGTYAAAPGDLDGDGDLDVVLVSLFNDWAQKNAASIVWLENDGKQNFKTWQIANSPIRLVTAACGDLNGDGRADIVAGSFHLLPPFERLGRITTWMSAK